MKASALWGGRRLSWASLGVVIATGCGLCALDAQRAFTTVPVNAPMATAAVSPDGRQIAMGLQHSVQQADGSWDNSAWIEVWDPASQKMVARIDTPSAALFKSPMWAIGFTGYCNNGRYLVAYDQIATAYVLDVPAYQLVSKIAVGDVLAHHPLGVLGLTMACSANANVFVMSAYGGPFGRGLVRLFDLGTGEMTAELNRDASSGAPFGSVALSPDGTKLAILLGELGGKALKGFNVEIRETGHLKLLETLATGDAPRGLIFAGESDIVTVQQRPAGWWPPKQVLRLWDLDSGKEEKRLSAAHVDVEGPITASADGRSILGYLPTYKWCWLCNGWEGDERVVKQQFAVWDRSTGAEIFRSEPFESTVHLDGARCALSQDGAAAIVYWPASTIAPRLYRIQRPGS